MEEDVDMFDPMDDGLNEFLVERANRLALEKKPLFKANMVFLTYQRQGLKGAVKERTIQRDVWPATSPHEGGNFRRRIVRGSVYNDKGYHTSTKAP